MQRQWSDMTLTGTELAASPVLYPLQLDAARDMLLLARLTEADYRAASFLDERMLTPAMRIGWAPFAALAQAARAIRPRPLHFIFHTGHVGSTLLSRLLDARGGVLGLREPLPLRDLADAEGAEDARLPVLLRLWARGFADTEAVVVKATSSVGRMAPRLLAAAPDAKAIYLYLPAEPAIATLIAGTESAKDQARFVSERAGRIARHLGEAPPPPQSPGEYAALAFLAENLSRRTAAADARVLVLDFEDFLAGPAAALARVFNHLGLAADSAALAVHPLMGRYSKAPDQPYSPALRAAVLAEAREKAGGEIARGLAWLTALARRHPAVAELL